MNPARWGRHSSMALMAFSPRIDPPPCGGRLEESRAGEVFSLTRVVRNVNEAVASPASGCSQTPVEHLVVSCQDVRLHLGGTVAGSLRLACRWSGPATERLP